MHANRRQLNPTAHRGAFTLIELLVTISIIAILVGILSPVALRMLAEADVSRARSSLVALSGALDEYRLATGEVPDHTAIDGSGAGAITDLVVSDINDEDDPQVDTTIGLFLSRIMQLGDASEAMLRSAVGRKTLSWDREDDGHGPEDQEPPSYSDVLSLNAYDADDRRNYLDVTLWTLTDPWDGKLRYASRVTHSDSFTDDDYLPEHPTPFFASAGPDEQWGNAQLLADREAGDTLTDAELEEAAAAEDNVYSFEIDG